MKIRAKNQTILTATLMATMTMSPVVFASVAHTTPQASGSVATSAPEMACGAGQCGGNVKTTDKSSTTDGDTTSK